MRRSEKDARLAELYAQVPDVGCKGLCHHSCTVIPQGPREGQRTRAAGFRLPHWQDAADRMLRGENVVCPALSAENRCQVHDERPMICRLYGAVEGLVCPHGCEPEGGLLPAAEGWRLRDAVLKL
ncbi:YkgJ family cysteine cluster protein [Streptosporangium sp. H16]|uniref:YkgJ family cysteine cluster protein n=1 Tax=Streptosporangium sp. H16 TaxID=3444184 RepID=UPI003F7A3F66